MTAKTKASRLKIHLARDGYGCKVELDGKDISRTLEAITIYAGVKQPTRAILHVIDVEIEAEGEVAIVDYVTTLGE